MATGGSLVTVLADSSFPEQIVDVAAFVSRSKPEAERSSHIEGWSSKATEAESDATKKDAIITGLVGELTALGDGNEREIEGVHNLVSALIFAVSNAEQSQTLAAKHISIIADDTTAAGKETVRYRILSNIFNSLSPTSPLRESSFLAMLNIAAANDEVNLLSSALVSLPQWLAQWQISESRKASVLESVASKLESSDAEKAYEFRRAHLQYLSSNSAAVGSSGDGASVIKQSAEHALGSALRLSKVFEFDWFLKLSSIDSLSSSSPALVELIKILAQGSLADWQKWSSSNAAELKRLNVDAAVVDRKVRLLEMAVLCSKAVEGVKTGSAQSSEVAYSSIAQAIQVPEAEVESWVIDVIRAGLVSGKLSQVTQTFRVYRSTHRTFGTEQWKILEARLQEWDNTLESIVATLSNPRNQSQVVGIPGADAATTTALAA
ncbi:unnamed protein product [Sympodiomycopsis kandeliae]